MNGQALFIVTLRSIGTFDQNILMTSNPTPARFFHARLHRNQNDDIRVHADRNRSFLTAAEYLRRIGEAQGHRPLKSEQPVDKLCQSFPVVEIRIVVDEVIRLDPLVHIIEGAVLHER